MSAKETDREKDRGKVGRKLGIVVVGNVHW